MKKLKITIYSNVYLQTETLGIKGKTCEKYFPLFQRILQDRMVDQTKTKEYYEEAIEEEIERMNVEI